MILSEIRGTLEFEFFEVISKFSENRSKENKIENFEFGKKLLAAEIEIFKQEMLKENAKACADKNALVIDSKKREFEAWKSMNEFRNQALEDLEHKKLNLEKELEIELFSFSSQELRKAKTELNQIYLQKCGDCLKKPIKRFYHRLFGY